MAQHLCGLFLHLDVFANPPPPVGKFQVNAFHMAAVEDPEDGGDLSPELETLEDWTWMIPKDVDTRAHHLPVVFWRKWLLYRCMDTGNASKAGIAAAGGYTLLTDYYGSLTRHED